VRECLQETGDISLVNGQGKMDAGENMTLELQLTSSPHGPTYTDILGSDIHFNAKKIISYQVPNILY